MAVGRRQFVGARAARDQHRLEIVEIEERQSLLVGHGEGDRQHAFLHLVQIHQPREKHRPHFGNGGATRVALFPAPPPDLPALPPPRPPPPPPSPPPLPHPPP